MEETNTALSNAIAIHFESVKEHFEKNRYMIVIRADNTSKFPNLRFYIEYHNCATEHKFVLDVRVDQIFNPEADSFIFTKTFEIKDKNVKNTHKCVLLIVNILCSQLMNDKFTFDKISNKLHLTNYDMLEDLKTNGERAIKFITHSVEDCCVCLEACSNKMPCCKGFICLLCYNKIIKRGCSCIECEEDRKFTFLCPLCRKTTHMSV